MNIGLISIEGSPSLILPVMQKMLIEKGNDCRYIHAPILKASEKEIDNLSRQISQINNFDLIGISIMSNSFPACKKLINSLKKVSKAKIIVGGVHAILNPEEVLEIADYVCIGDGEEALIELVEKRKKGKRTDNIKSINTKVDGKIKINKLGPIVYDLNKLPVPDFDLRKIYLYFNGKIECLDKRKDLMGVFYSKYYYIITSRGCPYECKYCLNHALIKVNKEYRRIRRRSNEHIIKELKNVKKVIPKGVIIGIVDDDFCAQSTEKLKEFCELYKKEIDMPFFCASTPTSMNKEKIEALINAGLIRLEIGIQSASDKLNKDIFGRYSSKENLIKLTKILEPYRRKIQICYDFILDNPWEKEETKIESLEFIMGIKKPATFLLFSLTLYPGTDLLERAKKEGIIKDVQKEVYEKNHMILKNDYFNTLFVLYTKYHAPRFLIRYLINKKDNKTVYRFISNWTYPLWRLYNYYFGLKDSIQRRDKIAVKSYLRAPFNKFISI